MAQSAPGKRRLDSPVLISPERVVIVGVGLKGQSSLMRGSLEELRRLTETAGGWIAAEFAQSLSRFNPGTLIGEGKILEIAAAARAKKARTVIFDMELSAAQQKNLEPALGAKVIDRTRLILDIFAQRAQTSEGKLQVELAQLSYMLPRLTGAWRSYSQQVGGIGTRGPGERQLEYERRHIQRRIAGLSSELERVKDRRTVRRQKRMSVPVPEAALIGYTNVGKSTLLNALTKGEIARAVYADDKLFATLDPTSRRVRLPEGTQAVVTDTVGFIQRLPTSLVAAFRSTLEEAVLADCLILVSDASSPARALQDQTVDAVLAEIGAQDIPRLKVFNKADLLDEGARRRLEIEHPGQLFVSAESGQGIPELLSRVQEMISRRWILRELDLPTSRSEAIAEIYRCGQVLSSSAVKGKIRYRLRLTEENWRRLRHKLAVPASR